MTSVFMLFVIFTGVGSLLLKCGLYVVCDSFMLCFITLDFVDLV